MVVIRTLLGSFFFGNIHHGWWNVLPCGNNTVPTNSFGKARLDLQRSGDRAAQYRANGSGLFALSNETVSSLKNQSTQKMKNRFRCHLIFNKGQDLIYNQIYKKIQGDASSGGEGSTIRFYIVSFRLCGASPECLFFDQIRPEDGLLF